MWCLDMLGVNQVVVYRHLYIHYAQNLAHYVIPQFPIFHQLCLMTKPLCSKIRYYACGVTSNHNE